MSTKEIYKGLADHYEKLIDMLIDIKETGGQFNDLERDTIKTAGESYTNYFRLYEAEKLKESVSSAVSNIPTEYKIIKDTMLFDLQYAKSEENKAYEKLREAKAWATHAQEDLERASQVHDKLSKEVHRLTQQIENFVV